VKIGIGRRTGAYPPVRSRFTGAHPVYVEFAIDFRWEGSMVTHIWLTPPWFSRACSSSAIAGFRVRPRRNGPARARTGGKRKARSAYRLEGRFSGGDDAAARALDPLAKGMRQMEAVSLADLLRKADRLGLALARTDVTTNTISLILCDHAPSLTINRPIPPGRTMVGAAERVRTDFRQSTYLPSQSLVLRHLNNLR
jgi:hypothetical protein